MANEQQPTPVKDTSARDQAIRTASIDMAIRSNCGQAYDKEGRSIVDAQRIISAAKQFEEFIKSKQEKSDAKW